MKWSLLVPFETGLPCGAVNVFSVYMLVHAMIVFLQHLAGCSAPSILKLHVAIIPGSFAEFCTRDLGFVLTPGSSNGRVTPE